jgi:hypothetical protein
MAVGLTRAIERRHWPRVRPEHTPWQTCAILRPGQDVVVINLSAGGALVESDNRMAPGARTELQLFGTRRCSIRGRVDRCAVAAVSPVRYRGAIVFEEQLDI